MTTEINKELLAILACPKCHAAVRQEGDHLQCQNPECRLRYPIRNGIPILLMAEATRSEQA
jgi:uncharacterized protein YbaR (Trm112 family)